MTTALITENVLEEEEIQTRPPLISVRDLHKYYELDGTNVHALRRVSLDIHPGEFVAIMGASGSGKSTFLNILGLLDEPSAGMYVFEDTDVSELTPEEMARFRNRRIAFIFQGFNLLPRTSALENVELPMLYGHVPKAQRHSRAREMLRMVGLGNRESHHPSQLSGDNSSASPSPAHS
jgi:putative ABC transport system ATP-binding protein